MKILKYLLLIALFSPLLFLSSCDRDARQTCQLNCSTQLVNGLDACDTDNPPNQPGVTPDEHQRTLNACYREKINAYRICVAACDLL